MVSLAFGDDLEQAVRLRIPSDQVFGCDSLIAVFALALLPNLSLVAECHALV